MSEELKAFHAKECNRYFNGRCDTRRCLVRGGWKEGPPDFEMATCEAHETILALSRTPTEAEPGEAEVVAASLSDLERELLLGESKGWGSWMFSVGSDLCAKGLGTKANGSITFDTPLAKQVIAALRSTPNAPAVAVDDAGWLRGLAQGYQHSAFRRLTAIADRLQSLQASVRVKDEALAKARQQTVNACTLIDCIKVEWTESGHWSEWDQSVRDDATASIHAIDAILGDKG